MHVEQISSFFDDYIFNFFSRELSSKEQVVCIASSVAIGVLSLRAAHIIFCSRKQRFSAAITKESLKKSAELAQKVALPKLSLTTENSCFSKKIAVLIQENIISPFYAKKFPPACDVTVTHENQKKRWGELTQKVKIEVNNTNNCPHNQHPQSWIGRRTINRKFMPEGNSQFLPNDPRKNHGSDHAARTAVIAPLFYYLYHKYHPTHSQREIDIHTLNLIQLTAAAHDSKRQTDATDVYNADSADALQGVLEELGVEDESVLKECKEAIAHKDSDPLHEKSLMAKCVQNADNADFSRLFLSSPVQHKEEFNKSLDYLDIYKEFCHLKRSGQITPQQFEEFEIELKAIRLELNRLIYVTHQEKFRAHASRGGANYFNEILATINKSDFPLLNAILSSLGIKQEIPPVQTMPISYILSWLKTGLDLIPTSLLHEFQERLQEELSTDIGRQRIQEISNELRRRQETENAFLNALKNSVFGDVADTFAALSHISKETCRPHLHAFIEKEQLSPSQAPPLLIAEQKYFQLSRLLEIPPLSSSKDGPLQTISRLFTNIFWKKSTDEDPQISHAETIVRYAQELLETGVHNHDSSFKTVITKAFEHAATIFVQNGEYDRAKEILDKACAFSIPDIHPLTMLLASGDDLSTPFFIPTGCDSVRRQQLRVCEKSFEDGPCIELSFELTSRARAQLTRAKSIYHKYAKSENTCFHRDHNGLFVLEGAQQKLGSGLKIQINDAVSIFVGENHLYWNPYNLIRIRFKRETPLEKVQQSISAIGLPTALMIPRYEDRRNEHLARILSLRYPRKMQLGNPDKDPNSLYASLSAKDQQKICRDLDNMKPALTGLNHIEWVLPSLPKKVRKQGGYTLALLINPQTMQQTAETIASILQRDFLSSQERAQRGLIGKGFSPVTTMWSGAGNQVFTRLFTEHQFSSRDESENFAVKGHATLLLDLQAFERIPYFYLNDRAGLRSPKHFMPIHGALKQWPIFPYRPRVEIQKRPSLSHFLSQQTNAPYPFNEVMFNQTLGAHYIRQIIVESEENRDIVLATLKEKGICTVNGTNLDHAVVISKVLDPTIS